MSYPVSYSLRNNLVINRTDVRQTYEKLQNVNGEQIGYFVFNLQETDPVEYMTEEIVFKQMKPVDKDPIYFENDYQQQEFIKPIQKSNNLYEVPEQDTPDFKGNEVLKTPNTISYNSMDVPYVPRERQILKVEFPKVPTLKFPDKSTLDKLFDGLN